MNTYVNNLNLLMEDQHEKLEIVKRYYQKQRLMIRGIPEKYGELESKTQQMSCELFTKKLNIPCGTQYRQTLIDRAARVGPGKNR